VLSAKLELRLIAINLFDVAVLVYKKLVGCIMHEVIYK
jgi:hypothetical protein